jgi:hypothetical protein
MRMSLFKTVLAIGLFSFGMQTWAATTVKNGSKNGPSNSPPENILYIVHIIPGDATNYTVSKEIADIEKSTRLSIKDFSEKHPSCKFKQEFTLQTGPENLLYEKVKSITATPGKKAVVGFSRSSLARLAAKAAEGSDLIGISIGASADDLKSFNTRFVTLASPWQEQWKSLLAEMRKSSCAAGNTLVIGDVRDSYSFNFRKAAADSGFNKAFNFDSKEVKTGFETMAHDTKCIFLAMNISTSQQLFSQLLKANWKGTIFGTGDWYYYSGELKELLHSSKLADQTRVIVPTGWNPEESKTSKDFTVRLESVLGHKPDPNGAYSYDAVQLALGYLCLDIDPTVYAPEKLSKLNLVRSYKGISAGGNYLNPIRLVTYDGQ